MKKKQLTYLKKEIEKRDSVMIVGCHNFDEDSKGDLVSYFTESAERFEEAGYDAMNTLLAKEKRPTAVIAAYDSIAIGAMKSIYEHGLSIPDDISLIGMDDESQTAYLNVPLTSTTSYLEDLCEIVVDVLFNRIENGDELAIRKINVSTELVERKSVGKAKQILRDSKRKG